jgi:hypothetical protein
MLLGLLGWARENENRLNTSLDLERATLLSTCTKEWERLAGLVLACTDGAAIWGVPYVNRKPIPSRGTHEPALVP